MLGLPVRGSGGPGAEHLVHGSASILFLQVANLQFQRLGALAARSTDERNAQVRPRTRAFRSVVARASDTSHENEDHQRQTDHRSHPS